MKKVAVKRMSTRGYIDLINGIHDIVFEIDVNAGWTFLNKSWTRIMGYDPEEVMGAPIFDYLHPDDRLPAILAFRYQMSGSTDNFIQDKRFVSKSGAIISLRVVSTLVRNSHREVISIVGTMQYLGQDEELKNISALFPLPAEDIVSMVDADGIYRYVSPSVFPITGYLPGELLGKRQQDFTHKDDLLKLNKMKAGKKDISIDSRFKTKGGSYKWFETYFKVIWDEKKIRVGFVASSRSIDIRKKAEKILLKSLKRERERVREQSVYVSVAAHEFRTPLAIIRSSLELAEIFASRIADLEPEIARHNQTIRRQVDWLNLLVDRILLASKLESGTFRLKMEETAVEELLQEVVSSLIKSRNRSRKVYFRIQGEKRKVMLDTLLFRQVVSNILSNALKYSEGRPDPVMTLFFFAEGFSVSVKDYGVGIPVQERVNIFQAFYRAENAAVVEGTGLGMFIAKRFMAFHNGKLSFKSNIGRGTEFLIEL